VNHLCIESSFSLVVVPDHHHRYRNHFPLALAKKKEKALVDVLSCLSFVEREISLVVELKGFDCYHYSSLLLLLSIVTQMPLNRSPGLTAVKKKKKKKNVDKILII
jgi:hypothetical protein